MSLSYSDVRSLADLGLIASKCTDCGLAGGRTTVVFGSGSDAADVLIVGEAPGQQEDLQGLPFVGRSGQLLETLLREIQLERGDVYIANVVKCRPPGNRDPRPVEIDSCKPYLRRQIELIDPKVVVTLGNFSTKLLLKTSTGITKMRGSAYEWWGRYLVPTFHPAAALRGGERVTDEIRVDLQLVRAILDGRTLSGIPPMNPSPPEPPDPLPSHQPPEVEQLGLFGEPG
jgi:uracil-DNA glycosylase